MSSTALDWDSDEAAAYDRWFETPWGRHAFCVEAELLRAALGDVVGVRVLDVGGGTGRFAASLEAAGADVVGIDLSPAMATTAARRSKGPVLVADGHQLPFRAQSFDVAMVVTVLEFVEDPERVTAELARVTKPSGRIVVGALNRASPWGLAHRRRLREPPWDNASFLTRRALRALAATHGAVRVTGGLLAPGARRHSTRVARACEAVAPVASSFGAFQLAVIQRT